MRRSSWLQLIKRHSFFFFLLSHVFFFYASDLHHWAERETLNLTLKIDLWIDSNRAHQNCIFKFQTVYRRLNIEFKLILNIRHFAVYFNRLWCSFLEHWVIQRLKILTSDIFQQMIILKKIKVHIHVIW